MGQSNTKFNKKSTAMETADNIDLNGKTILITGCNTGIGKETARVLAIRGAKIYMLCRNMEKANKAREDIIKAIKQDTVNGNKNFDDNKIVTMELDLSSLLSVRRCVGKYLALNEPIDYLINNAGVMAIPEWRPSKDGFEMQFATNHLGHFYLTTLLTPLLLKCTPSRVINLASSAHSQSPKIDNIKDNFITQGIKCKDGPLQKDYGMKGWKNYGLSKACNVLFAREYNRRYQKDGIISVSLHPGVIKTDLGRHTGSVGAFFLSVGSVFMKSIPQGAATTVRCVSLSNEEIAAGHYYKDCNEANAALRKDIQPYRGKKIDPPATTKPVTKEQPKAKEETEKKEDKDAAKDEDKAEAAKDEEPKADATKDDAAKEEDKPKESEEDAPKDDAADNDKEKEKDDGDKAKEEEVASEPKSEDKDASKDVEEAKKDEVEEETKTESKEIEDVEDVNSAEYKLWEWSELLITEKGFKLDMEGFEEEEKERQIQEEKEEAERLEKERLEKEAAEQKAKEEAEKAAKEEEEKKEDKDAAKEDDKPKEEEEEQPKAKEEETVKTEDAPKEEDKPKEEQEEAPAADEDKPKEEEAPKQEEAAGDDANEAEANEAEATKEEPKGDEDAE